MNKKTTTMIPLLAAGIVPATASAGQGDLDPGFGDLGRLGPILDGPAWSIGLQDDGSMLLAGGRYYPGYCGSWYCYYTLATNFISRLLDTGLVDSSFTAATLQDAQVLDVARQADGMVVAAGRKVGVGDETSYLVVFRLQANGFLDQTFAAAGLFELAAADFGDQHSATSMVLDPDGKIVVAGSRDEKLIVVRLLPDGSLDSSFGTAGVFLGPDTPAFLTDSSFSAGGARTNILRTAGGGYRVTVSDAAACHVVALTAAGAMDSAFGTAGIATVDDAFGAATFCSTIAAQADGKLIVAGAADGQAFAARILADGQADAGFDASAAAGGLSEITALAVGQDDSLTVAGSSVSGATIMRLQATGELDVLFGNAGSTLIDLPSAVGISAVVNDLQLAADGTVVAAGGANSSTEAFVVRLLGTAGGNSPGVLGMTGGSVSSVSGVDEVVLNVRRTGGASGSVSVAFQTVPDDATAGADYEHISGRLTWADGDMTERQVHVQLLNGGSVDPYEHFALNLSDVQGGAGLGTRNSFVQIAADGGPFGQLRFHGTSYRVTESGVLTVEVARDFYSSGVVSVTLTPLPGTATAGADFVADPVILSWADGDSDLKSATFSIIDDALEELHESFTIELSNATGGALIGPQSVATVSILANDRPPAVAQPKKSKGGGAIGLLSLLSLGLIALFQGMRRRIRISR